MLTVASLKTLLSELDEFREDINSKVFSADGYDAVIAILGRMRDIQFPCVVLEDRSSGIIGLAPGGFDRFNLTIWVMDRLGRGDGESELYDKTFALVKKIIVLFGQHNADSDLAGIDLTEIPYNKRMGGPDCRGYELILSHFENIPLDD